LADEGGGQPGGEEGARDEGRGAEDDAAVDPEGEAGLLAGVVAVAGGGEVPGEDELGFGEGAEGAAEEVGALLGR
jgi:hypothetical protein